MSISDDNPLSFGLGWHSVITHPAPTMLDYRDDFPPTALKLDPADLHPSLIGRDCVDLGDPMIQPRVIRYKTLDLLQIRIGYSTCIAAGDLRWRRYTPTEDQHHRNHRASHRSNETEISHGRVA